MDNIGKTTQLGWLGRGIKGAHLVGTVDRWDPRWRAVASGDFGHWWFVKSSTEEHVELMLRSHAARRAASGALTLEDRGLPMLRATCAATAVVKDGLGPADALATIDILATALPTSKHRRELHILLRRGDDPADEAAEALRREPQTPGKRYVAYQQALAEVLALQVERSEYDVVLDVGDDPILDVQRRLREFLRQQRIDVEALPDSYLGRLWVLAGMSESGKSTVGELLRDEHGVSRLKIGYLLEIAALRAGVADPYTQWPESEQAERLTEEILRFAAASKARSISVESAHRFAATAHLKRVWGSRGQIVFVKADGPVRASRAAETETRLRARDAIKRGRGAHRIEKIADHVVDNIGPLGALKLSIDRLVSIMDVWRRALDANGPVTHRAWLGQVVDRLREDQVALILATGSTGTESWREHWSDLDLLVVRDSLPLRWLREVVGRVTGPTGIKTAVSAFTTRDIEALRVPPRVVQSLRRAAQGIGVLYQRPGYLAPVPDSALNDRASRRELGLVLMTTRRLLADEQGDARALYKHFVLLAKILLRADGYHLDDAEDVIAAFRDLHPSAGCHPPALDELIRGPDDPALRRQLTDATERLLAYFDQLANAVRTRT